VRIGEQGVLELVLRPLGNKSRHLLCS
jgi:hypothetical protein